MKTRAAEYSHEAKEGRRHEGLCGFAGVARGFGGDDGGEVFEVLEDGGTEAGGCLSGGWPAGA